MLIFIDQFYPRKTGPYSIKMFTSVIRGVVRWVGLLMQMLVYSTSKLHFSSPTKCDPIYKSDLSKTSRTLLCYLSLTWMFNKLASALTAQITAPRLYLHA